VAPRGAVALKKLAAVLLAASMLSCSWTTWFVVMNSNGVPIRVTYAVQPLRTRPAITSNANVDKDLRAWRELDVSGARPDSDVLTIALGPDSSLLVAGLGTYTGSSTYPLSLFGVTSLRIITADGERSYSGGEVIKAFVERSRRLYVLEER